MKSLKSSLSHHNVLCENGNYFQHTTGQQEKQKDEYDEEAAHENLSSRIRSPSALLTTNGNIFQKQQQISFSPSGASSSECICNCNNINKQEMISMTNEAAELLRKSRGSPTSHSPSTAQANSIEKQNSSTLEAAQLQQLFNRYFTPSSPSCMSTTPFNSNISLKHGTIVDANRNNRLVVNPNSNALNEEENFSGHHRPTPLLHNHRMKKKLANNSNNSNGFVETLSCHRLLKSLLAKTPKALLTPDRNV